MTKNITWCLIKHVVQKAHLIKRNSLLSIQNYSKHTNEGYENAPQNINIDYQEVKSYKEFLNETKKSPKVAIAALMKTLDVTKDNATAAVNEWKFFGSLSTATIMLNDDLLREAGANKSTLRKHMFALAETTSSLKQRIKAIKTIDLNINVAIPLFQLTTQELQKFAYITTYDRKTLINYKNRILYMSNRFNCDILELCEILCRYKFMLSMSADKLIQVSDCLIDEFDMPKNYIIRDFSIYRYSLKTIKERLTIAKKSGISSIKPWVVRCPPSVIEKIKIERDTREKLFDSAKTLAEYISQQLNCDIELVNALLKRDPTIGKVHIDHLSKILELYRDYGYTIKDIYRTSRSLHVDVKSIKRKYDLWMKKVNSKPALFIITSSETIFNSRLEREERKQS